MMTSTGDSTFWEHSNPRSDETGWESPCSTYAHWWLEVFAISGCFIPCLLNQKWNSKSKRIPAPFFNGLILHCKVSMTFLWFSTFKNDPSIYYSFRLQEGPFPSPLQRDINKWEHRTENRGKNRITTEEVRTAQSCAGRKVFDHWSSLHFLCDGIFITYRCIWYTVYAKNTCAIKEW